MKITPVTEARRPDGYTCMDTIRMSKHERRHANASLRDGELVAAALLRAAADMRAIAGSVEHGAVSLAHAIKAMFARPAKH